MSSIKDILMKRDGMSEIDAEILVDDARASFNDYLASGDMDGAYNICEEFFGLEPDYLMEFMF